MKKLFLALLTLMLLFSSASCARSGAAGSAPPDLSPEPVVLRLFSNLPDRTSGQGLVEQQLIDAYIAENPYVRIDIETLHDEPYKTKFKAYASGNNLPDILSAWGQPSFLSEPIDAGLLLELNRADYADYGFLEGSLEAFSKNGKLYGLPRNTDIIGVYYNKKLFAENGWRVPDTYEELLALGRQISAAGMIPMSQDGGDKWPLAVWLTDLLAKLEGDFSFEVTLAVNRGDFSNPAFLRAAQLLRDAAESGLFQKGFETADYGTAKNLFINGQAAMFYMGSWEMSMATDETVPPEVRENIGVFTLPCPAGARGGRTDVAAWYGGGYAISANTPVRDEAVRFLNYMFLPENWSRLCWQQNVCISAQKQPGANFGNETSVLLQFNEIITGAASISDVTINDRGSSEFKTLCEDSVQELAIGKLSPQGFTDRLSGK